MDTPQSSQVAHRYLRSSDRSWRLIGIPARGEHRLFEDVNSGSYALADQSSRDPSRTYDGILWVSTQAKPLVYIIGSEFLMTPISVVSERDGRAYKVHVGLDFGLDMVSVGLAPKVMIRTKSGRQFDLKV